MTGVTEVNSDPNIDIELKKEAGNMQTSISSDKDIARDEGELKPSQNNESQTGHEGLFIVETVNSVKIN